MKGRAQSAALTSLQARRAAVPTPLNATSKPTKSKAKGASKPTVKAKPKAAEPSKPEATIRDGIPFLITKAMKALLREIGLTDEEIRQLMPAQAHERLNARVGARFV